MIDLISRNFRSAALLAVFLAVNLGNSEAADFHPDHWCDAHAAVHCEELLRIKYPKVQKEEDLVILPHRFLWGEFGSGAPENSEGAFNHLKSFGFKLAEVDFMQLADANGFILSHDYVVSRLTNASGAEKDWRFTDKTWADIDHLLLRQRNGSVSTSHVFEGFRAIQMLTGQSGIVVFADLKQKPNEIDPYFFALEWMNLANRILRKTSELTGDRGLSHLVFKTPYGPEFIHAHLQDPNWFYKVGWMPQVANDTHYTTCVGGPTCQPGVPSHVQNSVDYISLWQGYQNLNWEGLPVMAYETNYKNEQDSRRQPVGKFANILHYLFATTGRRGGVFAEEPVGRRGVVNREAHWDIKDVSTDHRGDPLFEAVHVSCGQSLVVTTDRTDVWDRYRSLMQVLPPVGCGH